ncbi:MAG: ABC transporter permease subunit [Anaerolineaceae bacterium]|nr:ABC transporter permease subunit [Anaerolineaceae bacterium]
MRWLGIATLLLWLIAPMIPLFIWSIAYRWFFPNILPASYNMRAWEYAFSPAAGALESLYITTYIAVVVTLLSILVGVPAGRALGLHRFRGKRIIELLILSPTIIPSLAVILGIHVVFIRLGIANSVLGVILVHLIPGLPYMTLVMAGVFANYDPQFEEQARSLGAGPIATIWYVMIPTVMPGIIVGGLFTFLISWAQYITTLIIGGGRVQTLPLKLFNFVSSTDYPVTGALGIIFIAPGVLVLLLTSRYLTGRSAVGGIGNI